MRRLAVIAAVSLVALAGCAPAAPGDPDEGSAPPASDEDARIDPVLTRDFPDPDVLKVGDEYFAYATNANLRNVQVAVSRDLVEWERLNDDALPQLPSWVVPGKTWAPEVYSFEPDRFTMYATATDAASGRQCIFRAVADDPRGPFDAADEGMLVCPVEDGGAIDAAVGVVDDAPYLIWKNDGNCCGVDTWLYASPLSDDGAELIGDPIPLIKQTLPWEGDLVEAPTLVQRDGALWLFYSANGYGGDEYAVGLATAPALEGPWQKQEEPLLSTALFDGRIRGPGGQDLVTTPDGADVLLIHGWNRSYIAREMYLVELDWPEGEAPRVVVPD
jgi:beta-xylosidase